MTICNCNNNDFIEYKLTEKQVKKLIGYLEGTEYYLHMPVHPEHNTPHVFCSNGSRAEITMDQAFRI